MYRLLQNSIISHGIGIFGTILIIHVLTGFRASLPQTVINSFFLVSIAYLATSLITPKITNFLLVDRKYYVLPVLTSAYSIVTAIILLFRVEYSREIIIYSFILQLIWMYIAVKMKREKNKLRFKAINNFDFEKLNKKNNRIHLSLFNEHLSMTEITDGLVVDLHATLTPDEEKFIADCSINNISVYHSDSIREMVEGKVQTNHLSENSVGTLAPSQIYLLIKRVWETILILLSFPVTLPIMLVTAIIIKSESKGPIFFIQERIGQGGKPFRIYKFRSMKIKSSTSADKFATEEQTRITTVGRVIRQTRIDELPQFFNVLKGDMALIGPRPEQGSFVKKFEEKIPFYGYRHMVKPGITGWAQTIHGYTDNIDSTRTKLAYDLFYIKHLSFWLDMNIVLKTIKTMVTGFGAK